MKSPVIWAPLAWIDGIPDYAEEQQGAGHG